MNQQGQGFATPLSIAETNQRESGRISSQRAFTTKAIAVQVWNQDTSPIVYQDVLNFLANSVLQWRFNEAIIEVAHANGLRVTAHSSGDSARRAVEAG
ncbi:MAG: hypothetical protein IIC01_13695, partial [Planctomycetes bacterium]|nr:hypothetical protein [Planctomycetota bacterium]